MIFALRNQIHKYKITQGIYIGFASIITLVLALEWTITSFHFNHPLEALILLLAAINGFLAWLFIPAGKRHIRVIAYSFFFAFIGFILHKYLFYVHYFHWQSAFYIDKSAPNLNLLIIYLQYTDIIMIKYFLTEWMLRLSVWDFIWTACIAATPFQYRIWDYYNDKFQMNKRDKAEVKHHVIKRRFG